MATSGCLRSTVYESTIKKIVEVCLEEFFDLEPYESKNVQQLDIDWNEATPDIQQIFVAKGYRKLPKGVSSIRMSRYDSLDRSRHPQLKAGAVPDFTHDNLNAILKKKEKALLKYKVCKQQWLVIGEGRDFYSYVHNIVIEKGFETNFDKVFMYRRWESQVIILK